MSRQHHWQPNVTRPDLLQLAAEVSRENRVFPGFAAPEVRVSRDFGAVFPLESHREESPALRSNPFFVSFAKRARGSRRGWPVSEGRQPLSSVERPRATSNSLTDGISIASVVKP